MRPIVRLTLLLVLAATAPSGRAAERHVLVISIDGFAAALLDDPRAPIPTIRRLAEEGAVAKGGMTVVNPSVTWPNHATLITGVTPEKHGVLANGALVRGPVGVPVTVDAKRDQKDLLRAPNVLAAAHAAGLRTADINWPCTRAAPDLDDSFPDTPDQVEHMTPRLREELVGLGLLRDATQKSFMDSSPVGRDLVWTEAACHVIRRRRPHLMVVHLLNVDATHHAFGSATPAGYTANGYADMCVARMLAALDEAGIRDRTTVVVLADHGFATTPKAIRPNVLLRQEGLLTVDGGKLAAAKVHVYPEGGVGLVYCTDPATADGLRQAVKELFSGREGVAAVILPEEFAALGLPHPRRYDQAPDAVLVAQDGYAVSGGVDGETFVAGNVEARTSLGSHGFLAALPKMNAVCVLSGRGIRRGVALERVANVDVAPTIVALLGLPACAADGRVLGEALADR
jgi:predicted AlkP superfamily pyrophosphatase or phosphodiesterase